MPLKTATVIGATGLIGGQLLDLLQQDDTFGTIRALVRRPVSFPHSKVVVKLVNFDDLESLKLAIDGSDAVFCAVGTTQKKVKGNKTAYRKVDVAIPVNAARFCAETGCESFLLVSAVGANPQSRNFYLRLKGEAEKAVFEQPVKSICIFRPSILLGQRSESRPAEKAGQVLMKILSFLFVGPWQKYHAVQARQVAAAMLEAARRKVPGRQVYEYPFRTPVEG